MCDWRKMLLLKQVLVALTCCLFLSLGQAHLSRTIPQPRIQFLILVLDVLVPEWVCTLGSLWLSVKMSFSVFLSGHCFLPQLSSRRPYFSLLKVFPATKPGSSMPVLIFLCSHGILAPLTSSEYLLHCALIMGFLNRPLPPSPLALCSVWHILDTVNIYGRMNTDSCCLYLTF